MELLPPPLKAFVEAYQTATLQENPLAEWALTWRRAKDLPALGLLMAEWLQGEWPCNPFLASTPPPEVLPLADALVHLNRRGFLTLAAQDAPPPPPASQSRRVEESALPTAAVCGWVPPPVGGRLEQVLAQEGLLLTLTKASSPQDRPGTPPQEQPTPHHLLAGVGEDLRYRVGVPYFHPGLSQEAVACLDGEALWCVARDPVAGRRYHLWAVLAKALS